MEEKKYKLIVTSQGRQRTLTYTLEELLTMLFNDLAVLKEKEDRDFGYDSYRIEEIKQSG